MVSKPANADNINTTTAGVMSWDGTATISTSAVTQYDVLVGGASQAISSIAPSATAGIPLVSGGSSANPSFTTAVVAGGGTGVATMTTPYAPVCAGTTATNPLQVASTGLSSSGYVLTSNGSSALPSFQAAPGGSITITGDTGGGLTGTSFTLTGGTTGLTFAGSGSTEKLGGDLIVANGGTGIATTTAFAPICGGTTATGAFQAATTGFSTSGYVLTSNGNAALPSFKATPSSSAFNVNIQTFVYTGGAQTYTPTSGMLYCQIEVCGGGGGSGGVVNSAASQTCISGAGGGGGYARGIFSAATIGASQTVTINAGGTAGTTAGTNGGAGGSVSVGSLISATGGTGGAGQAASSVNSQAQPAAGGVGTGGSFQTTGGPSANGFAFWSPAMYAPGSGGSSFFGGGANATIGGTVPGNAGKSYGGGASGAFSVNGQGAEAGAAGAAGIVIITEYISIASLAQYITWSDVTGTSASMLSNHGYIADNVGLVTLTLPATASLGDIIYVIGKGSGLWSIAQNSGQTIHINAASSTTGTGGSAASTSQYNYVQLVCTVANTDFTVMMNEGIITLT